MYEKDTTGDWIIHHQSFLNNLKNYKKTYNTSNLLEAGLHMLEEMLIDFDSSESATLEQHLQLEESLFEVILELINTPTKELEYDS